MPVPALLAVASSACFLALAHAAITTPRNEFRIVTAAMGAIAVLLLLIAPGAGAAILGPVVLSRRLANSAIPDSVEELLDRYPTPTE